MSEAHESRREVERLKEELQRAKEKLNRAESSCSHNWNTRYTPEYQEAYTIPGDPPGTMGVDWRGPVHVPAKTIKKWTRTCPKCGKTEVETKCGKETSGKTEGTWKRMWKSNVRKDGRNVGGGACSRCPFGSLAISCETHGFASRPHDRFAFVEELTQ